MNLKFDYRKATGKSPCRYLHEDGSESGRTEEYVEWLETELSGIIDFTRKASREIASDDPKIQEDLGFYEHLWAITQSYKGSNLACEDLHKYISFLIKKLNIPIADLLKEFKDA